MTLTRDGGGDVPDIAVGPGGPLVVLEEAVDDAEEEGEAGHAGEEQGPQAEHARIPTKTLLPSNQKLLQTTFFESCL